MVTISGSTVYDFIITILRWTVNVDDILTNIFPIFYFAATTLGPLAKAIYKEKQEAKAAIDDAADWMKVGVQRAFNDLYYMLTKKYYKY